MGLKPHVPQNHVKLCSLGKCCDVFECVFSIVIFCFLNITRSASSTSFAVCLQELCKWRDDDSCVYSRAFFIVYCKDTECNQKLSFFLESTSSRSVVIIFNVFSKSLS